MKWNLVLRTRVDLSHVLDLQCWHGGVRSVPRAQGPDFTAYQAHSSLSGSTGILRVRPRALSWGGFSDDLRRPSQSCEPYGFSCSKRTPTPSSLDLMGRATRERIRIDWAGSVHRHKGPGARGPGLSFADRRFVTECRRSTCLDGRVGVT